MSNLLHASCQSVLNADPTISSLTAGRVFVGVLEEQAKVDFPCIVIIADAEGDPSIVVLQRFAMTVGVWTSDRTSLGILRRAIRGVLNNTDWNKVNLSRDFTVLRCWEATWTEVMYEPRTKNYHAASVYRVIARDKNWI